MNGWYWSVFAHISVAFQSVRMFDLNVNITISNKQIWVISRYLWLCNLYLVLVKYNYKKNTLFLVF